MSRQVRYKEAEFTVLEQLHTHVLTVDHYITADDEANLLTQARRGVELGSQDLIDWTRSTERTLTTAGNVTCLRHLPRTPPATFFTLFSCSNPSLQHLACLNVIICKFQFLSNFKRLNDEYLKQNSYTPNYDNCVHQIQTVHSLIMTYLRCV